MSFIERVINDVMGYSIDLYRVVKKGEPFEIVNEFEDLIEEYNQLKIVFPEFVYAKIDKITDWEKVFNERGKNYLDYKPHSCGENSITYLRKDYFPDSYVNLKDDNYNIIVFNRRDKFPKKLIKNEYLNVEKLTCIDRPFKDVEGSCKNIIVNYKEIKVLYPFIKDILKNEFKKDILDAFEEGRMFLHVG